MTTSADFHFVFRRPAHCLAFGFGSGLSPFAPGTAGTLVGFPLFYLIGLLGLSPAAFFALIVALFFIGAWASDQVAKELGIIDYGGIVWDEIVAFLTILYFTPPTWGWYLTAFLVFRIFDVWKPYPIRYWETRIQNGFGVMFDDILAAVYSVIAIQFLVWIVRLG